MAFFQAEPLQICIDEEIALEGLDGITLDALWFRLSERLRISLPFTERFKDEIWDYIKSERKFEYFEIPVNRPTPQSITRDEFCYEDFSDQKLKAKFEQTYYIYKFLPIEENETVFGSCEHYDTRKPIELAVIKDMNVMNVDIKWHQKLVIVASQKLRSSILFPNTLNTDSEITNVTYCLLERIARSRYFGEMNSGKFSLSEFIKDSGLLHYQRNILMKFKLVIKQQFQMRIKNVLQTGTILFLPKFFRLYRHQNQIAIERVIEYLKTKPNYMADYDDIRNTLGLGGKNFTKLLRTNDMQKIVDSEVKAPYRTFYPNAPPEEYNFKSRNIEKTLNAVKLIQPDVVVYDIFSKDKDEELKEKEDSGFLDNKNELINVPLLKQAYDLIKDSKGEGLTQTELGNILGLSKLNSRSIIRNLERCKYIVSFSKDVGRQRVNKYILQQHNTKNEKIMSDEVNKFLKNVSSSKPSTSKAVQPPETVSESLNESFTSTSAMDTTVDQTTPDQTMEVDDSVCIDMTEKTSVVDNIENVQVLMTISHSIAGRKETQGIKELIKNNKVTDKVVRRMNFILETLKSHKVIDFINLMMLIRKEEEDNQKLAEMICRKSLLRLMHRMAIDKCINVVTIKLNSNSKDVSCQYFSDPSVTTDYYDWNRIIEEEKLRHFVPTVKADMEVVTQQKLEEVTTSNKITACPKFLRMKILHELLFYLIYDYPKNLQKIPIEEAKEQWKKDNKSNVFDDIDPQITCVYQREIGWKMFIPELISPPDYGDGWAFLRDVIHRIPLILFMKLVLNITPHPSVHEYLSHPVKCNYLLHFLPQELRESLMARRKYVFTIDELSRRLCFAGLLQFGLQKTKTKDDIFIYLNRNASLWDTTPSDVGYLEVSKKEYQVIKYYFKGEEDLKSYWHDMFSICTNTKLNKRSTAIGKELLIENLSSKPAMIKAMELRNAITAKQHDNGTIPGDHLGAGGLDKSFNSHLKQNWSLKSGNQPKSKSKKRVAQKKGSTAKLTAKRVQKKYSTTVVKSLNPRSRIIRKIVPPKNQVKKKVFYDAIDKEALKLMKTLRVQWSQVEDNTLVICRVAINYLFPNANTVSHFVNSSIFRDVLHWRYKQSLNKTSRACQRRILYITKTNATVRENLALYIEELRSNREFTRLYPPQFVENLKKYHKKDYEKFTNSLKIHLTEMIYKIHQIFFKFSDVGIDDVSSAKSLVLPKQLETFYEMYSVVNLGKLPPEFNYVNPKNVDELETRLLTNLIHGAICSLKDKMNCTVQLFDIYKNYKDANLTAAVACLRQNRIITINKITNMKLAHTNMKIVPFSFTPYHLSIRYNNQLFTSFFNYTMFPEYFANVVGLSSVENSVDNEMEITSTDAGLMFMLSEFIYSKIIQINYKMPEKFVSINPQIQKTNQPNLDQLDRFRDIIKYASASSETVKLKEVKKTVTFNQNDEKYNYEETPFEFIIKIHQDYCHIFCVLEKFVSNKKCCFQDVIDLENLECLSENCILKNQSKFNENCINIATEARQFIILVQAFRSQELSGASISKDCQEYHFLHNFEEFLRKCQERIKENLKKDCGTVNCKILDIMELLNAVQMFHNSDFTDGISWITDYSRKYTNDDDEDGEDEIFRPAIEAMEKPNSGDIVLSRLSKQIKGNEYERKCSLNDMFVVNFSKFYTKVLGDPNDLTTFDSQKVVKSFIPFTESERNDILLRIKEENIWKTGFQSDEDLIEKLTSSNLRTEYKRNCYDILNFIEEKGIFGATADALLEEFEDKAMLNECVKFLIGAGYVMQTGFDAITLVHWKLAMNWAIKTYHVLRSEKESAAMETSNKRPLTENVEDDNAAKKIKLNTEECEPSTSKAAVTSRAEALKQKEILAEERSRVTIWLRPCPWMRINGSLNRRVLDRWLATLLIHVASHPGVLLIDLMLKFNVMSPVDLRILLNMLESIGAIELKVWKEQKFSLFSEDDEICIEKATIFDQHNKIFVEICENAMQKLCFLIGCKKYKTEFI